MVGPTEASWLLREFDTLRQIRHENLIRVFDWGALPSGEAYYTMELIEGGDWSTALESRNREQVIHVRASAARSHIFILTERFTGI